jgi:hypothetical protein
MAPPLSASRKPSSALRHALRIISSPLVQCWGKSKRSEDPGHEFEHMDDEGHEYSKYESEVRLSGERRQEEFKKGFGIVMSPAVSTQLWLDRLQNCDFDVFGNGLRRAEWKLPFVSW